jgi:acyl CoA:acetate/3-ketoacid CoA transferase
VNVSKLPSKPYLTAGCGGFVDITTHAKNIVFSGFFTAGAKLTVGDGALKIHQEGKSRKLVNKVDHVTFSGHMALQRGQNILYITERCVMKLTAEGLLITEIAPGIELEKDVLSQAEFPLLVSDDLKIMRPSLFTDAVMGLELKEYAA